MFVSDSNIFPISGMKIRITNMDGNDYITEFKPDLKVDTLKIISLGYFFNPAESMKTSLYHKLLLVRTGRVLNEEKTLVDEDVQDNDELLLLKKRIPPLRFDTSDGTVKEDVKKIPTAETINKVTSGLPKPTIPRSTESTPTPDFASELRKLLISLIEASQKILCMNPEASKIFKQAEELLNESTESKIDESCLKQLTDMGFQENRAKKALILNKMSVTLAMEWLIQHESDPDIDTPLLGMSGNTNEESKTEEVGATGGQVEDAKSELLNPASTNILRSLRAFRKREFKPNQRALQHLVEMGFPEKDAVEALRYARNDQDAACDWLLGERKPRQEDMDDGLDTNSHIYKAIMANPTVQLGLNNPRCLIAFLQMLDSPWPFTAQQWLNDPDTGPLLVHISRIYHSEKHSDSSESDLCEGSTGNESNLSQTLSQETEIETGLSRSQESGSRRREGLSVSRSSRSRPTVNSNSKQTTL